MALAMHFLMNHSHRIAPALIAALTALTPLTARAYEIKIPWRGDSLPQLSYMWTEGHDGYNCLASGHGECGLDISGTRWDTATGQYSPYIEGATSPFVRSEQVAWGVPLYSPVDGEIIACFRNIPDDKEDGSEPDACPGDDGLSDTCVSGGNHVVIRTFDDHIVSLAHLQQHSIPDELCPITDAILFADDPKLCTLFPAWHSALREGARLDHRGIAPIPVRKGDFVGRVGLSGNVNGVHLHMSVAEITLDPSGNTCALARPVEFVEAWSQVRTPGVAPTAAGWDRLEGTELGINGTDYLFWADPLGPKLDDLVIGHGTAPALALTAGSGVAAYRNQAGNLAVSAMQFDTSGAITLGPEEEEGAIGDVALAQIDASSGHVIAAVQNGATKLQLIPYFVTTTADLVRGVGRTESTAGVGQVEATRPPTHDGIVVAIRNSSNAMSVISYGATLTGTEELTVDRRGSAASSTAISDLDIATVTQGGGLTGALVPWKGVVTVERRSSDDTLWVRSWGIDATGSTVTLVDTEQARDIATNTAFTVSDVDVNVSRISGLPIVALSPEVAVVSAATSSGLRVQSWQISTTGQLSVLDQWDAGSVTEVSSARVGSSDTLVGARTSGGSLTMISFHTGLNGKLGRVGTRWAGSIVGLEVDGVISEENAVVAALSPTSEVTLLNYSTNYSSQH
ncbi:hypothetical protein AB3662_44740 [Sorangium cellulosum]|uniref:hypothetical protein n=1 Tax=Sorangium cellulosum TaxID=56 RepID=UPI003D9AAB6F